MNIQRPKKLINLFLAFLVMMRFASCDAQKESKIVEVFTGIEIVDKNYVYSDESVFNLNNIQYSLWSKAIYDLDGEIEQLIIFKPEGALEYTKSQLLEDKNLLDYCGFPIYQNFIYVDGYIIKSENEKIKVVKAGENYLISKSSDRKVQIYKLNK